MKKALFLGILGSFFFAFTFVLNRSMNLAGGYWLWSAALRYYFTLPIMCVLLLKDGQLKAVMQNIRENMFSWLLWSTVGFGLFYAPLSAASVFAEGWFTAATWQITIVAGVLLTPVFHKKLPVKNLLLSCVILLGIFIMQIPQMQAGHIRGLLVSFLLIVVAAFSYPLGNRKMMELCGGAFTTIQRVFGMTLCSMPFWLVCGFVSLGKAGVPSGGQLLQSFLVALFSGVIATILFFQATDLVKDNPKQLAVIEATQSGEVIFTLLLSVLVLGDAMPTWIGFVGISLVIVGMILNSLATK